MAEQTQVTNVSIKPLDDVLNEVKSIIEQGRLSDSTAQQTIKDLRWIFDQESAKMNQAIYNDWTDKIHETCLNTVRVLVEILARS